MSKEGSRKQTGQKIRIMSKEISNREQTRARFHLERAPEQDRVILRLDWSFVWEFLLDGRTPVRALTDLAVATLMPYLEGPGRIIELGAAGNYYRKFAAPDQDYVISNLGGDCELLLDMTRMNLDEGTVDAFISVYALEHVFEYDRFFSECFRCLKPGGRLLLVVPFLSQYHGAPNDYFRFSASALDKLLTTAQVLYRGVIGGRGLFIAEIYHEKAAMGAGGSALRHLAFRLVALPFLAAHLGNKWSNDNTPITHIYLAQKPVD